MGYGDGMLCGWDSCNCAIEIYVKPEMISDLSPGDRLSLKGKLFELQRKLNLIDLEHKLDEQYPYKPTILEYDLPNRIPANFVENSNKAEIIRKVRKRTLIK